MFDPNACVWFWQITIDFKEEPNLKLGECEVQMTKNKKFQEAKKKLRELAKEVDYPEEEVEHFIEKFM